MIPNRAALMEISGDRVSLPRDRQSTPAGNQTILGFTDNSVSWRT